MSPTDSVREQIRLHLDESRPLLHHFVASADIIVRIHVADVPSAPAADDIRAATARVDEVGANPPRQPVKAWAADDCVAVLAAFQGIAAAPADQEIAASLAAKPIVAAAAGEPVIAAPAAEDVSAGCATEIVRGTAARLCASPARRSRPGQQHAGHEDEARE